MFQQKDTKPGSNVFYSIIVLPIMSFALETIEYANTKPFIPPITGGKVVKVYDADTITVAAVLCNDVYRFSIRLAGIDSPEIKSRVPEIKARAIRARDALNAKIFGKMVELRNVGTEKYGRLLADVYVGDLHINRWLLENGFATEYDGGTKQIPDEWSSEL